MGADLSCREERLPPLAIAGAPLTGIEYELPIASAQVKSCLLFAGLVAEGETRVVEPMPSRDHSERMLKAAGAELSRAGQTVAIAATERLHGGRIAVPADFSSAAFFLVGALLVPGSDVTLTGVGLNPTRTGLLTILERMGAEVEATVEGERGGEPAGTVRARAAPLRGTEIGRGEVPLAIDELPLAALAACFADGTTTIADAAELRRKESDRVATVTAALRALGGQVEATEDGMVIEGTGGLTGGAVEAHGDHRIAMLGAIAGLASADGVEVDDMGTAAISYPGFEADLASLAR
jgi:3-phosphoshikimate 1-carboxyvinyltransferase